MKTYLSIFKIKLMNNIQYRAAALAGISTQIFFGLVFIMVYLAFYQSGTNNNLPMNWKELASYLWLNQAFFSLIFIWQKDKELLSMIKDGNIAYELCRPIDFYKKWYATIYGSRIASVSLRILPVILISALLPYPYNLPAPQSILSLILFIVSLLMSSFLIVAVSILIHIITIFTIDEKGIMNLLMIAVEILSGGVVPLAFFPNMFKGIVYFLPFKYISDYPFRIYSGNIPINEVFPNMIECTIWLIIITAIGYILSKIATRKAIIQGG